MSLQDLTCVNVEASLLCVTSKAEELLDGLVATMTSGWLEQLNPLLITLKKCLDVMTSRVRQSLTFLSLHVS